MEDNLDILLEYVIENRHNESPESSKHKNFQVRLPINFFKTILSDNYRKGIEDKNLTESIKAFGMFQDPVLNIDKKNNACKIIDGEHRILSAIQAEQPFIDVTIYTNINPVTFREMQLDSNAGKEKIAAHEIARKAAQLYEHVKAKEKKENTQLISDKERTTALSAILERNPATVRNYLVYEHNVPKKIKQEVAKGTAYMNFGELVFAARNLSKEHLEIFYESIKQKKNNNKIKNSEEVRKEIKREKYKLNSSFELKSPKNNTLEKSIKSQINKNNSSINKFISFYEANKHLADILPNTQIIKQQLENTSTEIINSIDSLINNLPEVSKKKMQKSFEKLDGESIRRKIFKKLLNHTDKPKTGFYALENVSIAPNVRTHIKQETIDDLARSVKEHGQLQSGIITDGKTKKYEVVAGQRRRLAIDVANKKHSAEITHYKAKYYKGLDDLQKSILQIHEDVHKPDSKQERARALYKLFLLKKEENPQYEEKTFLEDYKRLNNKGDISKEYKFNHIDPVLQNMVNAKLITFDRSFYIEKELKEIKEIKEKHDGNEEKYVEFRNKTLYNVLTQNLSDKKIKTYIETEKQKLNQISLLEEESSYVVAERQLKEHTEGIIQNIQRLIKKERTGQLITQRQSFYDGLAKLYLTVKQNVKVHETTNTYT